jgi:hypothetical protein
MIECSMLIDHLQLIRLILKKAPRSAWPSAFCGIVAREKTDKPGVAEYLRNILQSQIDIVDTIFDIEEEWLTSERSQAPSLLVSGFVPYHCHYNEVDPVFDPNRILRALGLEFAHVQIEAVLHTIRQYTQHMTSSIRCVVQPYGDCALITSLLFALRDRIESIHSIKFIAEDWAELPARLTNNAPCDMSYMSEGLLGDLAGKFEFRPTKTTESKGCILVNAKAFSEFVTHRIQTQHPSRGGLPMLGGVNFNGKCDANILYFSHAGEQIQIQMEGHSSNHDEEARAIIALANGEPSYNAIIPTMQGFLWAVECGFLMHDHVPLGTLITGQGEVPSSRGRVGYGVRVQPPMDEEAKRRALLVVMALLDLQANCLEHVRNRLGSGDRAHAAKELLGCLKGPIVSAREYDAGMLARIPSELAVSAAFPGAALYEQEYTYRPHWWKNVTDLQESPNQKALKVDAKRDF